MSHVASGLERDRAGIGLSLADMVEHHRTSTHVLLASAGPVAQESRSTPAQVASGVLAIGVGSLHTALLGSPPLVMLSASAVASFAEDHEGNERGKRERQREGEVAR